VRRIPRDVSVHVFCHSPEGIRYLLLRRVPERGGFWQGVTGAPLHGETDVEAAVREVREETGFDVVASIVPLGVLYSYRRQAGLRSHEESVYEPGVAEIPVATFAAEVSYRLDPVLSMEHDDFGWFDYEEAAARLDWPVEADALEGRRAALRELATFLADELSVDLPPS
jgi:8-oxo-dGTP pyrophosphatase MutT (NUDIX family)